jgi:pyrimidine-nucleoside phosphorylase
MGEGPQDIAELSIAQAGLMLMQGGAAASFNEGIEMATENLGNGAAHAVFLQMIAAQGGDVKALDESRQAAYSGTVCAASDGILSGIDAFEIGLTSVQLGAGRQNVEDKIDPYAGFTFHKKLGDVVRKGEPIVTAHAEREVLLGPAIERAGAAIDIDSSGQSVELRPLISHVMDNKGLHSYDEYRCRR